MKSLPVLNLLAGSAPDLDMLIAALLLWMRQSKGSCLVLISGFVLGEPNVQQASFRERVYGSNEIYTI